MRGSKIISKRNFKTEIQMVLTLLLTILVSQQAVEGFVPIGASSSRVPSFVATASRSPKLHVLSGIDKALSSEDDTEVTTSLHVQVKNNTRNPLKKVYRIYTGYAKRLWRETDPSERSKIANDKVAQTARDMHHVLTSEHETISSSNSSNGDKKRLEASAQLLKACEHLLSTLEETSETSTPTETSAAVTNVEKPKSPPAKKEKKPRSILFGALMGAVVACWVFSGNYIFTGLFCLITILGQLEYYRMVMNTGVFAARRISVIGATSMFVTVCSILFPRIVSARIFAFSAFKFSFIAS